MTRAMTPEAKQARLCELGWYSADNMAIEDNLSITKQRCTTCTSIVIARYVNLARQKTRCRFCLGEEKWLAKHYG